MKTKLFYLLTLFTFTVFAQFPTNGILGYYKFDSGNVLLDQAGVSNLSKTGTSLIEISDRFDSSMNGAVLLNTDNLSRSNIAANTIVSHAFWIKTNINSSDSKFILGDSDRPGLSFNSSTFGYDVLLKNEKIVISGRYQYINRSINTNIGYGHTSENTISDDIWHHVVVEFTATRFNIGSKIYIDGVLDATNSFNFPGALSQTPLTSGNLVIGNNRSENLNPINQYQDGFDGYFIYNRALSLSEINILATQDGFCLVPQSSILSIASITENNATINISNGNTYDIAYVRSTEPFSNAIIITNVSSTTNLTGLNASTPYNVFVREQCASGNISRWSDPIEFRTLGQLFVNDDAMGLNDGSSWVDAFTDLKSALDVDVDGQEIWVASGTYKRMSVIESFVIDQQNVKLYGGFAATEVLLSDRVLGVNETIISGDNNGNDSNNLEFDSTRSDNTRRIILLSSSSDGFLIDGFTITAGISTANGTSSGSSGGGIYNIDADNVIISNCKFFRNGATIEGGAIWARTNVNGMIIDKSIFEENFAVSGGAISTSGVVASLPSPLKITNSIFINNITTSTSAAIYGNYFNGSFTSSVTIDACEFKNNTSRSGGAIYITANNSANINVSITNSLFDGNKAEDNINNTANSGSSAWLRTLGTNSMLTSIIVNNTFVNNIDTGTANGLNNFNRATLALTKNNTSSTHVAEVSNNIFYDNETAGGVTSRSITGLFENIALVNVKNSIDENNFSSIPTGNKTNTSSVNPLFTDVANSDFTLTAGSPAENTGLNSEVMTATDLLGNQRVFNTTVDMGAYEFGSPALSTKRFKTDASRIKLYPNPATSTLNIETKEIVKMLSVYSILGSKILESESKSVDVSGLPKGVYLLKIKTQSGSGITKRFIKN